VKIVTCGFTNLKPCYLSDSHVCFADSEKRASIDRKVMRLSDPPEAEKIISGSPSVLRHVDPDEVGSDSDHGDFEKFISGFEAENRDQTVVRKHGSQSAAVASTSRQHASEFVAVASTSRQAVASSSSQPVASTSRQAVSSRQAVPSINRSVLPEDGNVLKPNAEDGRQRNTAPIEVCFEW